MKGRRMARMPCSEKKLNTVNALNRVANEEKT
jgi:hypothetical protein